MKFLKVTLRIALVLFTTTLPKLSVLVEIEVGAMPVPESATGCAPPASVLMVRVPDWARTPVGVYTTPKLQFAPAAMEPVVGQATVGRTGTALAKPVPVTGEGVKLRGTS